MDEEIVVEEIIKRKPRTSPNVKFARKLGYQLVSYSLPIIRYSIIPGIIFASIYYTEPQPSLLELLNPFF